MTNGVAYYKWQVTLHTVDAIKASEEKRTDALEYALTMKARAYECIQMLEWGASEAETLKYFQSNV